MENTYFTEAEAQQEIGHIVDALPDFPSEYETLVSVLQPESRS